MGPGNLSNFVGQFKRVLSEQSINSLGRLTRFCQRERVITPYRLAVSVLASCATTRVQTLADIQRHFNALFGTTVAYKPFHNQLAKRQFADFMRELVSVIIERWTVRVLGAHGGGAFSEFGRILIQDGSSFAVNDALAEHYPGRFHARCPAAVELHVTMDLLQDRAAKVTLTADTAPERPHLPPAHTLDGDLLLADRGYFDRGYLREVGRAGGHYVVRGKTSLNPVVQAGFGADGAALRGVRAKRLHVVRIPKKGLVDFDVVWGKGQEAFSARLIASWNRSKRQYRFVVTNLPRRRYPAQAIEQVSASLANRTVVQGVEVLRQSARFQHRQSGHRRRSDLGGRGCGGDETLPRPYDAGAARRRSLYPQGRHVCPSSARESHRRPDFKIP